MTFLDEKFNACVSEILTIPAFHSCDSFFLRKILNERKLSTSEDDVFENEKLLYLFYGRPAYKSANQQSSKLKAFLPISFIVKSESIDRIKRVISFDSGAFKNGLYNNYLHPQMSLDNFILTPTIDAVKKAICYLFGTNENYFKGIPKEKPPFDPLDFEIECLYNLISGNEQQIVDDRKSTFEIQLDNQLFLTNSSLEAVILPDFFLSSELVTRVLVNELKVEILSYESYGIPSPDNYSHLLYLTKKYLYSKKYLND